jgi:hypothetical protein
MGTSPAAEPATLLGGREQRIGSEKTKSPLWLAKITICSDFNSFHRPSSPAI